MILTSVVVFVFAMPQKSFVSRYQSLEGFDCAGQLSVKKNEASEVNHPVSDAA